MTESLWVLRNAKGIAIDAGPCAHDALRWIKLIAPITYAALMGARNDDPTASHYEHAGYTLALEPHARPEVGAE